MMIKRWLDILGSFGGLVVLAPLFLVVGVAVKLTSPGPVFYRQTRLGRFGRRFDILKFRSMVADAELRGDRVTGAGDARVTGLGRILRRHKIDELPQLVNVLRGEMSLVGPRPEVPEFAEHFPAEFARLLTVRPGITHRATQQFRNEEDLLGVADDPRAFYLEQILPRKLDLYLAGLDRASIRSDLLTILDTVFNRSQALEPQFLTVKPDAWRSRAAAAHSAQAGRSVPATPQPEPVALVDRGSVTWS